MSTADKNEDDMLGAGTQELEGVTKGTTEHNSEKGEKKGCGGGGGGGLRRVGRRAIRLKGNIF